MNKKAYYIAIILLTIYLIFSYFLIASANEYTNQDYCNVIYIIEGKEKARQPFGIETIECKTYNKCEQICLNTIANNRIRYKEYGYKKYKTFEEFLASRYCPFNQVKWTKMLKFYLKKGEKS